MIGNWYRDSPFGEIQEPHPQPPPRLRGGDYDVYHVIIAVARLIMTLLPPHKFGLLFPMRAIAPPNPKTLEYDLYGL